MNFDSLSNDVGKYPDLKYIVDTVTQILELMSTDEMINLKQTDVVQYEQIIHDKFVDFCDKYYSLFSLLLDGKVESLSNLITMINTLCMVKTGQISMDAAYTNIREDLSNKYIYPKYGGKREFERSIIERSKRKHKKN